MDPAAYEAWYETPRGRWMGDLEHALLSSLLRRAPGGSLLDIGCGTGHFTRLFARDSPGMVVGIDPDGACLSYARAHGDRAEQYVAGRAEALPFPDRSFDYAISVAALCFVHDQATALRELVRVTRRRFVLGLLNRRSLLYLDKGRQGGSGGYRGAHWHTAGQVRVLLAPLPVANVTLRSGILLPRGVVVARALERCWPRTVPFGGFLAVAADVTARH